MAAILPIVALVAWVVALTPSSGSWRHGMLAGAVVWGVALVALTELLGLFHALTLVGLSIGWALVLVLAAATIAGRQAAFPAIPRWQKHPVAIVLGLALAIQLGVLAAIAWISPPNTWDSMSYHMARLIHWQESGSVAPYPAYVLRQLYMPPGAEFVMLHLQILTGGDWLACLVQWTAMLGSVVGVSLIARELGARRAGQLCAAVFAASVPIGVLEATSTQNDHVVAFWLVCCAAFGLRFVGASSWASALLFGASLGLAMFTKATAYVWAAPLLVSVVAKVLVREQRRGLPLLAVSALVALAINAGMYTRNLQVFGQPLGQTDEGLPSLRYLNDTFEPGLFAGTLARDVGINFVTTPWPEVNTQAEAAVVAFHAWLGVDLTDPRTTWSGERFRAQSTDLAFNESFASNPLHLAAIVLAIAGVLATARAPRGTLRSKRHGPFRKEWPSTRHSAFGEALPSESHGPSPDESRSRRYGTFGEDWPSERHGPSREEWPSEAHGASRKEWRSARHGPSDEESRSERYGPSGEEWPRETHGTFRKESRSARHGPCEELPSERYGPLRQRAARAATYGLFVLCGMLLFAAVVRWQPWHTRLELPFFILGAPLVGVVLERISTRLTYVAAALLLVYMLPYVISNDTRSLTGERSILSRSRTDQYFTNWPDVRPQYLTAIKMLADRNCTRVAFAGYADSWEYPLWALLPGVQEVEQVSVPNASAALATPSEQNFQPCAVLALGPATSQATMDLGGTHYQAIWSTGKDLTSVALLTPQGG